MQAYDLVVVGSGPGGYIAGIRASQLGMRVAIVEEDELGGVCLNWGCIPTKSILRSAEQFDAVKRGVPGLVVDALRPDYPAVIDASRKAAGRLTRGVASLMKKNAIEVLRGRGRLLGGGQVGVSNDGAESALEAPKILLATGSTELVLPGVELDDRRVLTSREALASTELPGSIVIVGGGAVGLEFAYVYAAYGARVTVVEMEDQILPGFDSEVAGALAQSFARRKIGIRTGTRFQGVDKQADRLVVSVEGAEGVERLEVDRVLFGVGRRARVEDLGLEQAGVRLENGFIHVGDDFRTSADGVWAIGDVIGPPLLAHAASEEGVAAVEFMAGERSHKLDYDRIPWNIYCQPQVASIGLSEKKAREAGREVAVGRVPFVASGKAVAARHTDGFVKMVADGHTGEILGCQIVGADATELIAEVCVALALESTVREVGDACHAHPTLSEVVREAALAVQGRALNF